MSKHVTKADASVTRVIKKNDGDDENENEDASTGWFLSILMFFLLVISWIIITMCCCYIRQMKRVEREKEAEARIKRNLDKFAQGSPM